MNINKTSKTNKNAKSAEALTTVGVRISKREMAGLEAHAKESGRTMSDVLRTCIAAGMMVFPDGMDIVAVNLDTVRKFQEIKKAKSLGLCLEQLMEIEIARHESAQKLSEYRRKIRHYRIDEVHG